MDRRVDDPTDSGLRLHTFGFDGQPAGDTSAFLRAVAVELPEARQDSAFHADVANADKLADAWSLRDESHLRGSNDTNATMDVFAIAQAALIIMGGNLSPATKPCDSCGGEFEIGSFSKKEWRAAGWGRCRSCVQKGKRARYSDFYRPAVPGSSKIDGGILCHPDHPDPLAAILREYLTEDYGTDCVERLIKAALEYPTTFKHYLRLYYYKLYLLDSLKKAGVPSDVVLNLRRAIYDIPDYFRRDGKLTSSTFHQFTDPIRQAMSKGKKKLRLACKKVFLAMDEVSERVPLNDIKKYVDGDTAEAMTREELIERRADEAGFVPSIERLVDDLVPMLRPEHRDHIDRFLMGPNGTPLTSEQRKHPDWIKLVRLCFNFYVGSKRNDRIDAGIFNRCVERQRDEFRQQATESQRYKPIDLGLPLRRRCDNCGVDKALAEWLYPYCTSCNAYWLSPNFRRMDRLNRCCPICLLPPKSAEFSYTLRCGHTLHLKCLEYARSVRAECPGENILSVCPVCSDPITDDLEKVVFVQDVWPEHMEWWPGPDHLDVAFSAESAAECAHLAASAAVRDLSALVYYHQHLAEAVAAKEKFWEDEVVRALLKVKSPACFCESLRLLPCRDSVDAATKEEVT